MQGHVHLSPDRGHVTCEAIPAAICTQAFGPLRVAVFRYLSGSPYIRPHGLEDICEVAFGVSLFQGSVTVMQQQRRKALASGGVETEAFFGCPSEEVYRFAERQFRVMRRPRLPPSLDYLVGALFAHRHGVGGCLVVGPASHGE